MTDTANAPERIWMTAEDHGASWHGAFRAFRCSNLDHSNDDGPNPDYPEYVLATHCDELVEVARAEGALEAQAKIARLTEALDEKQDGGKDFWMKWTQKRLEINRAMFLRDAKMALAGDMRALRNRVELMEAEPVPLVLSAALQENANE